MASLNRKRWFQIHGWLALPVWVVFCFVCLTGTIAVVSHEITWLANPAARAHNPDDLPRKPLPELVDAVREAAPQAHIADIIVLEPYLVTAIGIRTPDGLPARAYVNPYTAEVQAIAGGPTFIGFMRSLHGWLLFPWHHNYSVGYYLVAAMSLVTLGALITGVVIYRRFWRAYTRPQLRLGSGLRVFMGDLHRLTGAWSLWFLLIIGTTGLWYLTQAVLWHNEVDIWNHPDPVPLTDVPFTVDGKPAQPIDLAEALERARTALPSIEPSYISLPEFSRGHISIAGSGENWLFDQYAYRAFVDPWSGEIAQLRQPASMNALQILSHIADPLHYGTLGGLWTKLLWFVFGLLLSAMSVTGFVIWGRRTTREAGIRSAAKRSPALEEVRT
ncbi:MAG: PepSY domain-containing protein [Pseudazoarcus pumilus]|nr:PepSY domain-containing protein [Pseudazoarcus pumilus]